MIEIAKGDLLAADVDALVNTVNCVGVMGKGLALQVRRQYPEVYKAYERACRKGEVTIGRMFVVPTNRLDGPQWVINFPTKVHWRAKSRLSYIEDGLQDLVRVIRERSIRSIAVPPLGSGNGGLDWRNVRPIIEAALGELPDVRVLLFEPSARPAVLAGSGELHMTWGRALLLEALRRYVTQRSMVEPWEDLRGASHLEIQKLMYFANEVQPKLKLAFEPGRYGPYSEKVRHLVQGMEGAYLKGHGDGSGKVLDLDPIGLTSLGERNLDDFLAARPSGGAEESAIVSDVMRWVEGFEGPYGVELLASTHWVAKHEGARTSEEAATGVRSWTKRKGRLFTDEHVALALQHLENVGAL
jgi:O-acetyl-ADP-ribose deacetylase (regulator of RNase III)